MGSVEWTGLWIGKVSWRSSYLGFVAFATPEATKKRSVNVIQASGRDYRPRRRRNPVVEKSLRDGCGKSSTFLDLRQVKVLECPSSS